MPDPCNSGELMACLADGNGFGCDPGAPVPGSFANGCFLSFSGQKVG